MSDVQFLTDEWAAAVANAVNESAEFKDATRKKNVTMLFRVTGTPRGDLEYHMRITPEHTTVAMGAPDSVDLTFESTYEVAVQVAKGTLNGRDAVTRRKMKADANIMKLMKYASIFTAFHEAQEAVPVSYEEPA